MGLDRRPPKPVVGPFDADSDAGLKYWKSGACWTCSLVQATFSLNLVGSSLRLLAAGAGPPALLPGLLPLLAGMS